MRYLPYSRQDISAEDIAEVARVLASDFITQGEEISRFEKTIADYCGAPYAVAVSSGTAGLHLACLALGLRPGDLVWTSPISFVASANCALYCGAAVDFVDIDPETYNLSIAQLESKLKAGKKAGKLPNVLVVVHFAGQPGPMKEIRALADEYGFRIIEDAAQALGSRYGNLPTGACQYSDACVFSFHPTKTITTGEGGMVTTQNPELAEKIQMLRVHGITRLSPHAGAVWEGWYYEQQLLGHNFRMSDIHAVLGSSQMKRISFFLNRRAALARRYDALLSPLPLRLKAVPEECLSAHHLYPILIVPSKTKRTRNELFQHMRAQGIGVNVHYIPIHTQPYFKKLGFAEGDFPQAEHYYPHTLSIPLFPSMTEAEQDAVVACLVDFFDG